MLSGNSQFFFLCVLRVLVVNCLLFFCSAVSAQTKTSVRVAAETTVETEIVKLGNIAQIDGETEKSARLKTVSLGYAPNVGAQREISRAQIMLAILAAGFSENEIVLDAPTRILIRRAGQIIAQTPIRETIAQFLSDKFSGDKITAKIVRLDLPDNLIVPAGAVEIRPNYASQQNYFQPFSLPVEIRVDGKVVRRLAVNVEIEAFTEVLVAVKDLALDLKITPADVRVEKRRIIKPITNYLRDPGALRGLMLIKAVASGAEITSDSFISSAVIKNGDPVRVEAQSGKLKIIINGEARSSGKIGDRIAVKNLQSGLILQAVVIDEGLVRVLF
jgi:flagella basal body P-ring formation protein FlgA